MKVKFNYKQILDYIKIALITLLAVIEVVVVAQAYSVVKLPMFIALVVCCVVLAAIEGVNEFLIKKFVWKMVFFGFDCALLLAICLMTGDSYLSTLYCIVLTGCYMTVEKFKDKTILFGFSCGLYFVSFIASWLIRMPVVAIYESTIEILSGAFFGLLVITIDYIVVLFILKFYNTNRELSAALKEADASRAQREEVYEQLTQTKVFEERNRIAKDIHDNAGHSMTTVIMQTEAAKLIIDTDTAEAKNRIISANIQARNALEQMRESVHLLAGRSRTGTLGEEVKEIIAQTIDGTDIRARYDIGEITADENICRFVCNSVKELLANGIRHGNATAFYIELKEVFGNLQLIVSDNGTGVQGEIEEGFGLKGIRENAEKLNGKCTFESEDGEGFETEITLPLHKEEK